MSTLPKSYTRTWPASSPERRAAVLALLAAALCAGAAVSLRCGSQDYSLSQLTQALLGGGSGTVRRILLHVRIPRTLAAALSGGALAMSGALIQAVLNNTMASPNVIGVNAGAGFAALLAATWFPGAGRMPLASFLGAFLTALFIYLLAMRAGLSRTTLILAGLAVSSILTAGSNTITLLAPDTLAGASGFMMGGFSGVTLAAVGRSGWYLAAGAVLALFLGVELNVLQLGEESAASLGLHVGRVRFLAILAAALLAGAAVSFSGLLGFVGGILAGVFFLNKGYSLKRTYRQPRLEGMAFPIVQVVILVILVFFSSLLAFSESGPGSKHAPFYAALVIALAVGALAQKSRLCMVGGMRDAVMFRDFNLLSGFGVIFVTVLLGNVILGNFHGFSAYLQPIAHASQLWNLLGMVIVGWGSVLLGGCPLRQLILAGEGNGDSAVTVFGMIAGAAFAHNFKLAGTAASLSEDGVYSAGGIGLNGKVAVAILFAVLLLISVMNLPREKKASK